MGVKRVCLFVYTHAPAADQGWEGVPADPASLPQRLMRYAVSLIRITRIMLSNALNDINDLAKA